MHKSSKELTEIRDNLQQEYDEMGTISRARHGRKLLDQIEKTNVEIKEAGTREKTEAAEKIKKDREMAAKEAAEKAEKQAAEKKALQAAELQKENKKIEAAKQKLEELKPKIEEAKKNIEACENDAEKEAAEDVLNELETQKFAASITEDNIKLDRIQAKMRELLGIKAKLARERDALPQETKWQDGRKIFTDPKTIGKQAEIVANQQAINALSPKERELEGKINSAHSTEKSRAKVYSAEHRKKKREKAERARKYRQRIGLETADEVQDDAVIVIPEKSAGKVPNKLKGIKTDNDIFAIPHGWDKHKKHLLMVENVKNQLKGSYDGKSITLGALTMRHNDNYIAGGLLPSLEDGHLVTVAPTRSGKGTTQIIPNLLSYNGSVLVVDIKGENYDITHKEREKKGKVIRFAPFEANSACYNPINFIRAKTHQYALDDARLVAELLAPQDSNRPSNFWEDEARNFLAMLLLYVAQSDDLKRDDKYNMAGVVALAHKPLTTENDDGLLDAMAVFENDAIATWALSFLSYRDQMQSDVLSTVHRYLRPWESPTLQKATSRSDFSYFDLIKSMADNGRKEATSIYLVFPPDRLRSHSSVLRLMVGLAVNTLSRRYPWEGKPGYSDPAQKALFIVDEFPSLGFMPSILDAFAYLSGYGVTLWCFVQNIGQLQHIYGQTWQTFVENSAAFTAFGINGIETASYLSSMLGQTDEYLQYYIADVIGKEKRSATADPHAGWGHIPEEAYPKDEGWEIHYNGGRYTAERDISKKQRQSRFTKDQIAAPSLIRQLPREFGLVFIRGKKPALYRCVPYFENKQFDGKYGAWKR